MIVVDAFAGVGWAMGLRSLGMDEVGVDLDPAVCALRAGLGLRTIRADVAAMPVAHLRGKVDGAIFSPPCQSFSAAGKQLGLADPRGLLVRPVRWVEAMRPRWVACEQVKEVLPYWRAVAARLRALGYSTWTGTLDAADYGVPQNRPRAFLVASLDVQAEPPEPTHSRTGHAEMFGDGRRRWVSMAEALGWGMADRPYFTVAPGTASGGPGLGGSGARRQLLAARGSGSWVVDVGQNSKVGGGRKERYTAWAWERPATAIMGDRRVFPPDGHHPENGDPSWSTRAIPVELWELGVLQGFPADFPWHLAGTKTAQARVVGNAVPPPVAAAVVGALTGAERTEAA